MPYCLNPECPHRAKTGKPAEYLAGVAVCSDCGGPLSSEAPATELPERSDGNDFRKRVFVTLGILLFYRIFVRMPVPTIDYAEIESLFPLRLLESLMVEFNFSIIALGLSPYIFAYMLVAILSLFMPPLKGWRSAGHAGRTRLFKTALAVTTFLAFFMSYGMAKSIEAFPVDLPVWEVGVPNRAVITLTFAAGSFVVLWMAFMITRHGIGHGVSVILASGMVGREVLSWVQGLYEAAHEGFHGMNFFTLLLMTAAASLLLIAIIVLMERAEKEIPVTFPDGLKAAIPLKLTTAGLVPVQWSLMLIMVPVTIFSFSDAGFAQRLTNVFVPGALGYYIALLVSVVFLYYLFTALFHNTRGIVGFLDGRKATLLVPEGQEPERYIDRFLSLMAFFGSAYLVFFLFLPIVLLELLDSPVVLGGTGMIVVTAVVLDVWAEVRARKSAGPLVKIEEYHDIQRAGLLKSILEAKGIPCHVKGYYHRALLYFFGPFVEVSVLVPEQKAEEAIDVIKRYMAERPS